MTAVMQEIVDLNHRVGHLEHATYESWELPIENGYVKEASDMKKEWLGRCEKLRGSGDASLGSLKNFIFLGLINALLQDTGITEEDRKMIREVATTLSGDGKGNIDPGKVRELHRVVAYGQITLVTKTGKAFLNIRIRSGWMKVEKVLFEALTRNGKRQYDAPPLKPRTRDIREAVKERTKKK